MTKIQIPLNGRPAAASAPGAGTKTGFHRFRDLSQVVKCMTSRRFVLGSPVSVNGGRGALYLAGLIAVFVRVHSSLGPVGHT